ncbi:LAFA_0G09450g1_1 [Lachancea sp. 'fantastica']|nr:LAFA_0G09450g1_1 [Lachancea sp. 'fantastica']
MNEGAVAGGSSMAEHKEQRWSTWISSPINGMLGSNNGTGLGPSISETEEGAKQAGATYSWFDNIGKNLPSFLYGRSQEPVDMNNLEDYGRLSDKQIKLLELEAQQGIRKKADTWCWFEDVTTTSPEDLTLPNPGELSVANTGSAVCPLPLVKFPVSRNSSERFYVQNSLILPNVLPSELFHGRTTLNKVSAALKNYYNFEGEKHTYLSHGSVSDKLEGKRTIVVSFVGGLPEKYEKATLGKQVSAKQLTSKIAASLKGYHTDKIVTFSLEAPLDQKPLEECIDECTKLLCNWKRYFNGADLIIFAGVYHSVPLQLQVSKRILEQRDKFGLLDSAVVGLLGIESCLGGYHFWDHSSDSTGDANSANYQANREKFMLQGCTRVEQDNLSQIARYRDPSSIESRQVQCALDWMFRHQPNTKLVLFGKLYDNFMTISEKLAINLHHPNILRHVWCEGSSLGLDFKKTPSFVPAGEKIGKGPIYYRGVLKVPQERAFEVSLIEDLLMAINLGHTQLIPMLKMISPFFISRSFNKHTVPATVKKQQQYELKAWLQEMDQRWKNTLLAKNGTLPAEIDNADDLLTYVFYKANKPAPDRFKIKEDLFDDTQVLHTFLHDTVLTTALLEPRAVELYYKSVTPVSILNSQNQYDLVWQIHDFLSYFAKIKNLPLFPEPQLLFSLAHDSSTISSVEPHSVKFRRGKDEASRRIEKFWEFYQEWKPPTKGLKQLHRILSFLSLYSSGRHLQVDLRRIQ